MTDPINLPPLPPHESIGWDVCGKYLLAYSDDQMRAYARSHECNVIAALEAKHAEELKSAVLAEREACAEAVDAVAYNDSITRPLPPSEPGASRETQNS